MCLLSIIKSSATQFESARRTHIRSHSSYIYIACAASYELAVVHLLRTATKSQFFHDLNTLSIAYMF